MPFAAKYQALAAALNAQYSTEPEVAHSLPEMLFAAVDAEDAAGNSLGFLQLFLVAIAAHVSLNTIRSILRSIRTFRRILGRPPRSGALRYE
ncbi:MAG: hypothetical protein WDN03_07580 [Rhizomicrobium sp.]